ncbi:MAG: outer membrane protein transport protein [Kiritimatiellae bacterium]|nr:outer membrane protein transport protein [Kiritimatiellia bacterium]
MNMKLVQRVGLVVALASSSSAWATNGDSLEGIGAISSALGGTGVAAPQDGLTALVNNPAGLAVTPGAAKPEATVGLTLFQPTVDAKITTPGGVLAGGSDDPLSLIPFLSYSRPAGEKWSVGIGAYGVSGMGVDYRGKGWDLDGDPSNGFEGDIFSKYSSLKVVPAAAYKVNESFVLGLALHGNYSTLDFDQGKVDDVSVGAAIGASYRIGSVLLGASYTTPQKSTFKNVFNFDAFAGDTQKDDLALEQPAIYAVGAAWNANERLLIEANAKYLPWGDSEGYKDFDWENQWVYAVGVQYKATEKLDLRAGFNYAANPVKEHNGWDPNGLTSIQGTAIPVFGYELFRNVGFPAIVESHVTLGFGYKLTETLALNVAYVHVFEKEIESVSAGEAIKLGSTLSEDSLGVGLTWAFN